MAQKPFCKLVQLQSVCHQIFRIKILNIIINAVLVLIMMWYVNMQCFCKLCVLCFTKNCKCNICEKFQ